MRKRLRIHSNIVGCFCFAENRGMLPSIELLVFLLNELDVIVIVINRRLLVGIESWNCVVQLQSYVTFLKTFCLYCYFSVLWWNKTDKCIDLWLFSSVAVLLLCIRPIDHAGGLCMSPILLYRENWVRIVLFISKPVDVVFYWFRVNSLKFICTICLVVFKHIRSGCNKFRKC